MANPNESPIAQLFAFVIVTATESKMRIAATFRESEKLGALCEGLAAPSPSGCSVSSLIFMTFQRYEAACIPFWQPGRVLRQLFRAGWQPYSLLVICKTGLWQDKRTFGQFWRRKNRQAGFCGFLGTSPTNSVRSRPSLFDILRPCLPFRGFFQSAKSSSNASTSASVNPSRL